MFRQAYFIRSESRPPDENGEAGHEKGKNSFLWCQCGRELSRGDVAINIRVSLEAALDDHVINIVFGDFDNRQEVRHDIASLGSGRSSIQPVYIVSHPLECRH